MKSISISESNRHIATWIRIFSPPYRDYRFWLIQALNLLACIQLTTAPINGNDIETLTKNLESSWTLKSFMLFFLVSAMASGIIFGLRGVFFTILLTSIFAIPKLVMWSPLPYDSVFIARIAVISGASAIVAYFVSREHKARVTLQVLNEKMTEIIREKDRFFKLASEAQENERRRISRDLHDDSLQLLAAVIHQLDGALSAENPEKANAQVVRAKETITQTSDAIRRYCEALRPMLLDTLGLLPAVEWIGRELEQSTGIKVSCDVEGVRRIIRGDDRIHIFRVMQEAFHNISKHSKATAVRVHWKYSDVDLEISVTDNGIGMWNSGPIPSRSLGIQGMHERMELVGGKLLIESQPGFGSKVTLLIPYE